VFAPGAIMNRMFFMRAFVTTLLTLAACAGHAQIYRWFDENGRAHAGDTPPPGARNVEKVHAATPAAESVEPYALQLARKNAPVTLYSTPNCPLCGNARALLNQRGVPFKETLITDKNVGELMTAVGANAVPSIVVGSAIRQGFEETTYHAMLDAAGYPKLGVLPPRDQKEPALAGPKAEAAADEAPRGPYAPGGRRSPQK